MKTKKNDLKNNIISIDEFFDISKDDFFFVGGPCVIEDEKMIFLIAEKLKNITQKLNIPFIFKASYDKANRTSINSFRGPGLKKGLKILSKVREKLNVPILTDVHETKEINEVKKVVDVIQIPAFLCRQTDLVVEASKTGKVINIKKGQFLSPYEVENIVKKVLSTKNNKILLTERGFTFGYNNLVVDLKSIAYMKKLGYPVIIDATHAVQRPGGLKNRSAGEREYVEIIAKGGIVAGANGVFLEIHHDVKSALSDRDTQYPLNKVESLLKKLKIIFEANNEEL